MLRKKLQKKNAAPRITNIRTSSSKTCNEAKKKQVLSFRCCCTSHRQRATNMRNVCDEREIAHSRKEDSRTNGIRRKDQTCFKIKCGRASCCSGRTSELCPISYDSLDLFFSSPRICTTPFPAPTLSLLLDDNDGICMYERHQQRTQINCKSWRKAKSKKVNERLSDCFRKRTN